MPVVTIANTKMRNDSIVTAFKSARNKSVPLVVVRTTDATASGQLLAENAATIKCATPPILRWDNVTGLQGANIDGGQAIDTIIKSVFLPSLPKPQRDAFAQDFAAARKAFLASTVPAVGALKALASAPEHTVALLQNAQLAWRDPQVLQAAWNLRDLFKTNFRMLILLTPLGTQVPTELASDSVTLEEPLPTQDQLRDVIDRISAGVGQTQTAETVAKSLDALAGVRSVFMAEQQVSMCIRKSGIDVEALLKRQEAMVNDTPGLSFIRPVMTMKDLGGAEALKTFFKRLFTGNAPPSVIIFMDEIDDMFAGSESDSSGISTMIRGKFLTHITRSGAKGVLTMGHPGVGKSAIMEAVANEYQIPLIGLDLGDTKNHLVGQSEERIATALKVIDALSFGRALYVGTCNSVGNLAPQLQRRFPWRFFFDLPTADEKALIWPIYEKRPHADAAKGLTKAQLADRPDDTDYTGAEIKETCENAWRFNCTLREASDYVVQIAKSMPEAIDQRRKDAAGRYLSASYPGVYRLDGSEPTPKIETKPFFMPMPRAIIEMNES